MLAAAAGSATGVSHGIAPAPSRGLQTAVIPNPVGLDAANQDLQFARIRAAGATAVRLAVRWDSVAPSTKPAGFDPTNPGDPAYRWTALDPMVIRAYRNGLNPILLVLGAPIWAQGKRPGVSGQAGPGHRGPGPYEPNPTALGQFATALAHRYSGAFEGLPRVRDFIAWNEPNNYPYLSPQRVNGKPFSPYWYRLMVNAFALGVHSIHADNRVVAGALLFNGVGDRISPLAFMRNMLCMSKPRKSRKGHKPPHPHPTCRQRSTFDVWSHHPYTRGNPFRHAQNHDDVMMGDLPHMRELLNAAVAAHHIVSNQKLQFWVDEFSYDSSPPDPSHKTVPILLHARYVSESLYQMWRSGVSLATWFLLRDEPIANPRPHTYGQSGLYANQLLTEDLSKDTPKPALTAFRFPFVAYRVGKRVSLWGRTPTSTGGRVSIQIGTATGWRTVGSAHAGSHGTFVGKLRYGRIASRTGHLPKRLSYRRAVLADKPRSYWRLDDRGKVARDELGHALGVYQGSPKEGVPGIFKGDRAVRFGVGSQVVLPPMTPPHTIELWAKTTSPGAPFASFRDTDPRSPYLGDYRGYVRASGGGSDAFSYDLVDDGSWHQLVFTVAPGGTARLYVDGTLDDETAWQPGTVPSAASLAYDTLVNRYFNGVLDEVAVYDHALTAAQVARHYDASGRVIMTRGMLRARFDGETSWPFSLARPKDRFVLAFG